MKKIAIVFDTFLYGGIERVGLDYISLLMNLGYEVDIFILTPNKIENIVDEVPDDCKIYKINFSKWFCPEYYWRVAKIFWWGKYLLPIFYLFSNIFIFIYKIFIKRNKKYDVAIAFSGHINDLSFITYDFLQTNKKCCWLHGGIYGYMAIMPGFERLYKKINNLVVLKEDCQDEVLFYNNHLKDLNIKKIYNPSFISEKKKNQEKILMLKKKYGEFVLMVSRLSPPKNHKSLIKAMKYIKEKYGVVHNLVLVGDGPLKEELKSFVAEVNMSSSCFFEGVQSDPQNYYAAACLFAFSSFSEGLPTVLIEAGCFGLPIVASDSSVREILGNNEYGLVCPIDDYVSLGESIYRLLTDKKLYDQYSEASKKRFLDFAPETISNQIEIFLKNIK